MTNLTWTSLVAALSLALVAGAPRAAEPASAMPASAQTPAATKGAKEVTLKGTLGCGKCSFHEAKACENVLKVKSADGGKNGGKDDTYVLADNAVSQAHHEKVCGPTSPATVQGTVSKGDKKSRGRKILTASVITFE